MQTADTVVLDPLNRGSLVQPMPLLNANTEYPSWTAPQRSQGVRMRASGDSEVIAKAPTVSTCPYIQYHPKRSSSIRKVDKLYVGMLLELPPPDLIQLNWNVDVRTDLENDLCQATRQLPQNTTDAEVIVELVLCMAGGRCLKSDNTTPAGIESIKDPLRLMPMVWIYCGSKKCKKKVDETIRRLPYLHQFIRRFNLNPPHSSLHGPWPAASETTKESSSLEANSEISFHVLQPREGIHPACGLGAKFTVNDSHECTTIESAIGGMVVVNGKLYGLSIRLIRVGVLEVS